MNMVQLTRMEPDDRLTIIENVRLKRNPFLPVKRGIDTKNKPS